MFYIQLLLLIRFLFSSLSLPHLSLIYFRLTHSLLILIVYVTYIACSKASSFIKFQLSFFKFSDISLLSGDCISLSLSEWLYFARSFHFFPSVHYPCFLDILMYKNAYSKCRLREVNVVHPIFSQFNSCNYLYLPYDIAITIQCGSNPLSCRCSEET